MRILCLIDDLGPGGAQRQLCAVAVLLKRLGEEVTILTYHPKDFYLPLIKDEGIEYKCMESSSIPRRILSMRRELRHGNQDVVLAFLPSPVLYAEFAAIPWRNWGLVVSERSAVPGSQRGRHRWRRLGHLVADYVTANSHTNRLMIERSVPALKGRVVTVYNAVDLDHFSPDASTRVAEDKCLHFVVVAKFRALKNPVLLVEALASVKSKRPSLKINLDWYGPLPGKKSPLKDYAAYDKTIETIEKNHMGDRVRFHPAVLSIVDVYRNTDALISPSFYEGLSNVICEAMACGRPVLASNVSDVGNQVHDGHNGFLFNPSSVDDMTDAILRFADLTASERNIMGMRSREMAEQMFDPGSVAAKYAEILSAAAQRKRTPIEHWVPQIPESVNALLEQ
jgi:glycosyltransferase involved in cell wall biosynthesis